MATMSSELVNNSSLAQRFQDKSVIVTGAGSGIGRAVAIRLIAEGASVLAIDLNEDGLKETQNATSNPERVTLAILSVTDEQGINEKVNNYATEQGHIDVLINVAGIIKCSHSTETTLEEFQTVLNTNLIGTFLMCRACLPHLIKTKGNIVNTASIAGICGHPYMAAYAASKGAVIALTKSLAREYISHDVRVNAVAPGGTLTPLVHTIQFPPDVNMALFAHFQLPKNRLALPEEIATVIATVASNDGSFINGEVLRIDGGVNC